jgi:outer membrane protein assembly factor BamA
MTRALLASLVALTACGGATAVQLPGTAHPIASEDRRSAACSATALWVVPSHPVGSGWAPQGKIRAIDVTGATGDGRVTEAIGIRVGDELDPKKIQSAERRLWALDTLADVEVDVSDEADGVRLQFRLTPQPELGQVFVVSPDAEETGDLRAALRPPGTKTYSPRLLSNAGRALVEGLSARGYVDASLTLTSARNADGAVDVCATLKRGPRVSLDGVRIEGLARLTEAELLPLVGKVDLKNGTVDEDEVSHAIDEVQALMYERGLLTGEVHADVQRTGDRRTLVFRVQEGPVFKLRRYEVTGDRIAPPAAYLKLLKTKPQTEFRRSAIVADRRAIDDFHAANGRPDLSVDPEVTLDAKAGTVDVSLHVVDPTKKRP